jgi:chorismate synthase
MKPASSIGVSQETYHLKHQKIEDLKIEGRHDAAIVRRAGIVLENAIAIVMADLYLQQKA